MAIRYIWFLTPLNLNIQTTLRYDLLSAKGRFGPYGGSYIPEVIRPNMDDIAYAFENLREDTRFKTELDHALTEFSGRPTPLTPLHNLSKKLGGAQLYLKNEGLNLTGAHKINHCLGQVLVAKHLGKKRIIAETGAGQHGYATATVCARYGLECIIYMGRKDYERQRPNVFWMELLGAKVIAVDEGSQTLNDAVIAAFKDLISHPDDTYYLLGSTLGPHPYPIMNTWFQQVVGQEVKQQLQESIGRTPDACVACVGGGSNASGLFYPFLDNPEVRLLGVEAGGKGSALGEHAVKFGLGKHGIFEGYASYFLQDEDGNISPTHSISAGLDYCGISPILAYLKDLGRIESLAATDAQTLEALQLLARTEGIILALESAHGLVGAMQLAQEMNPDQVIVLNGSGRGEKDLFITLPALQPENFRSFLTQQLEVHS